MDFVEQEILRITADKAQQLKEEGVLPLDETKYDSTSDDLQGDEGGSEGSGPLPE